MREQIEKIVDGYIEDLNENYIYVVLLDDDGDPYGEVKFKNNPMYRAINPVVGKLLRIRIDSNNYARIALSTMDGYPAPMIGAIAGVIDDSNVIDINGLRQDYQLVACADLSDSSFFSRLFGA